MAKMTKFVLISIHVVSFGLGNLILSISGGILIEKILSEFGLLVLTYVIFARFGKSSIEKQLGILFFMSVLNLIVSLIWVKSAQMQILFVLTGHLPVYCLMLFDRAESKTRID